MPISAAKVPFLNKNKSIARYFEMNSWIYIPGSIELPGVFPVPWCRGTALTFKKEKSVMKPFVLKQHDKDFAALRSLRAEELAQVSGGLKNCGSKSETLTVTPDGDGGDDHCDAD